MSPEGGSKTLIMPKMHARSARPGEAATARDAEPLLSALIERHRSGDPTALKEFVASAFPLTHRFVYRLTGPSADYEDLVQASLEQVCVSASSYAGRSRVTTFIFGICNRVVSRHRRAQRIRSFFHLEEREVLTPDEPVGVEAFAERRESLEEAQAVLARVDPEERAVFVLHELENLPLEEVAAALNLSSRTVKRRLHSVRAKFTEARR